MVHGQNKPQSGPYFMPIVRLQGGNHSKQREQSMSSAAVRLNSPLRAAQHVAAILNLRWASNATLSPRQQILSAVDFRCSLCVTKREVKGKTVLLFPSHTWCFFFSPCIHPNNPGLASTVIEFLIGAVFLWRLVKKEKVLLRECVPGSCALSSITC